MSFPTYSDYKDSGLEWLGSVPEHWQVTPLRGIARPEKTAFIDGDWIESPYITDEGVRLLQTGNIGVGAYKEQGFRYISEATFADLKCTEVEPGDVLICRLAEPVGRACIAPDLGIKMITSVDVCIVKVGSKALPRFMVYFLSSTPYLGFMESQCRGGTRDRVSRSFLGSVRVILPPLTEQSAITAFLDRETAKIDALVAEQEKLIELLKEKRQAVISHAVTKGLDPNVPMKDSGVAWIGAIPEHWTIWKAAHAFASIGSGTTPPSDQAIWYEDGTIPWVTTGELRENTIQHTEKHITKDALDKFSSLRVFPAGSVAVAMYGATIGRVGILGVDSTTNQACCVLAGEQYIIGKFAFYWLIAARTFIVEHYASGGGQPNINQEIIRRLRIPTPPRDEQTAIVNFIFASENKLTELIREAQRAIDLLKERRSALISAAVTGKIDVRGLVETEATAEALETA